MHNPERLPSPFDLPCDLGEFLSRRRNVPIEDVTEQLGEWLVAYEAEASSRPRRSELRST
jgi:hypothetical protein